MNDRARFDVLVAPRAGSVIEVQQRSRCLDGAKMRNHPVRERLLGHAEMTRMETSCLRLGGAPRLSRSSSDPLVLVRRRR